MIDFQFGAARLALAVECIATRRVSQSEHALGTIAVGGFRNPKTHFHYCSVGVSLPKCSTTCFPTKKKRDK